MFGGLSGLSLVQKIYLECSMLSAISLPILLLNLIDDALATTLLYQAICLIAFPALYIKYLSKEKDLAPYFLSEFRNKGIFIVNFRKNSLRKANNLWLDSQE